MDFHVLFSFEEALEKAKGNGFVDEVLLLVESVIVSVLFWVIVFAGNEGIALPVDGQGDFRDRFFWASL